METSPTVPEKNKGGRPLGSIAKVSKQARELAAATGDLPHEILLKMARGLPVKIMVPASTDEDGETTFVEKWQELTLDDVRDAAKAAAPYYAPKLSTVETITGLTDEQLDDIIRSAAAEAAVSVSPHGEGTQGPAEEPSRPRVRIRIET